MLETCGFSHKRAITGVMFALLLLLGSTIIILTLHDVVLTTLLPGGSGFFSQRIASSFWRVALLVHQRNPSHRFLALTGVIILLMTVVSWALLLWIGWTFVLSATDVAVVTAATGAPVDLWTRLYFTGYTLITLGIGDIVPKGGLWQVLTIVASASGFFLATLAITYLLSVVSAVVQVRQAASYISSLGDTPYNILLNAWNGRDCSRLTDHQSTLIASISKVSQQHLAYPILYYFHSPQRIAALGANIAALDEALGLLTHGLRDVCEEDALALRPLQRILSDYLSTLQHAFIEPADEPPPTPSLEPLRDAGLLTSDEAFEEALQRARLRRRLLKALVTQDGWEWRDVYDTSEHEHGVRDPDGL